MRGGKLLGALVFNTLAACFLIMVIAGRDAPSATSAPDRPEAAPPTVVTPDRALPEGARIIPLQTRASTPQPTLRPSPEHRVTASPPATPGETREVAANRLNLRAAPEATAPVLTRLARGQRVLLLSDGTSEWTKVRPLDGGTEGWVATRLLRALP